MRLSGMNFNVNMNDELIQVDTATCSIDDSSDVVTTGGVPDGYADGEVRGNGEIVVKASVFKQISNLAKKSGSWRGIKPFDMSFYGKTDQDEVKVEAFGCKIKLSDILDLDKKGGQASTFKIPYLITSPDFVHIDGVPYLRPEEIEHIVQ